MPCDAALAELRACPSCGTRLTGDGCLACRVDFPLIGGIPWLMPEPRLALGEWRGRLHHLLSHYAAEAARQRAGLYSELPSRWAKDNPRFRYVPVLSDVPEPGIRHHLVHKVYIENE